MPLPKKMIRRVNLLYPSCVQPIDSGRGTDSRELNQQNCFSSGIDVQGIRRYAHQMDAGTEKILLTQLQAGDEGSFAALINTHSARLVGMAWRMVGNREDAEDLVQETFIRLYKNVAKFRGDSGLSTWLYQILSRLAIDHLRRQKLKQKFFFLRNTEDEQDPLEQAADPGLNPGEIYLAGEAGRKLNKAMDKLSARQRMVFILRHHEGMPLKEVAEVLELEFGTVKAHLHRAIHFLRNELKDLQGGLL